MVFFVFSCAKRTEYCVPVCGCLNVSALAALWQYVAQMHMRARGPRAADCCARSEDPAPPYNAWENDASASGTGIAVSQMRTASIGRA